MDLWMNTWWAIPLLILNMIIAIGLIFFGKKNPSETMAWIMVLFFIPVFGLLLYIFFAQNMSRKKLYKASKEEADFNIAALRRQAKEMDEDKFHFSTEVARKWRSLIRLNQVYANSYLTQDNSVEIITDGHDKMNRLIEDIQRAKECIHVQYFIIKRDKVGRRLMQELTKKAREGVEVKLLVDALGSMGWSKYDYSSFKAAGGQFASFFPTKLRFINLKLNYRNHRKIVVIDDKIAYIGGFNIGKEYLGKKRRFGYWRDTHLRYTGSAVQDANVRFLMDWRFASKDKTKYDMYDLYFPRNHKGTSGIQLVSSGPDSSSEEIKRCFMRMITTAEKSIFIQTPYFVPDDSIQEALKMAAQSGVDVRIMIPNKPDHMFVYWATYSYVAELMRAGARIYVYDHGFMHAKTMAIDSEVCTVGSANFDRRSFRLNFETNVVIYDDRVTRDLEAEFEKDMILSWELTPEIYKQRSWKVKFKEPISRLLSDIL